MQYTKYTTGFLVALLALASVFSFAGTVFAQAAGELNGSGTFYPVVLVKNVTVNGSACTGLSTSGYSSSISVNAGDTITLAIWYENTGSVSLNNVRATLSPQTTGSGTSHTFSASVSADNAASASGSVTVSVNGGAQSLSFVSASWYPGPNTCTSQSFPSGQAGNALFSGGVSVGTVVPSSTSRYGFVRATFLVSGTGTGGTTGAVPVVTTQNATQVTQNTALLNGTVNPSGAQTSAWFEYGLTQSFGNQTSQMPWGNGNSALSFSQTLTNLSPNATYYYRIAAQNSYGTVYGNTLSFVTTNTSGCTNCGSGGAPLVTTYGTTSVGDNYANLQGDVSTNGSQTTVWFDWGYSYGSLTNRTTQQSQNNSGTFTGTMLGLQPNSTYYFRAAASNQYGTNFGQTLSFTTNNSGSAQIGSVTTNSATNVTLTSATLNGYINNFNYGSGYNNCNYNYNYGYNYNCNNSYNYNSATHWFEYGTTPSFGNSTTRISQSGTSGPFSDSVYNLQSNTTYYFRAVAQSNTGSTAYGQTLSFSTGGSGLPGGASVTTMLATQISESAARLNGLVLNNNSSISGWFEWGLTPSFGNTTVTQNLGTNSPINYSQFIQGLSSNTLYYYRAVIQTSSGAISRGDTLSFRANSQTVFVPSVTSEKPARALTIEKEVENVTEKSGRNDEVTASAGDTIRFTITVVNDGASTLRNLEIRDRIPEFLEFTNASDERNLRGIEKEVVWVVSELKSGDQVRVTLDTKVSDTVPDRIEIENVARVEGVGISQTSNSAIVTIDAGSSLAAALFFGNGSFLPDSLLEWLILIILILALVLLSKKLYGDYEVKKSAAL